ncbi:MAG: C_GCAxxG_C_C family protein, partial [Cyclobacteriaceae bacterium]|nr:C_GCAxxG_C_C family protein [Cyclobacteriaceae bacterium]
MSTNTSIKEKNDAKKLFRSLGACSHTFFHILNREYGHIKRIEERASDPFAGGIYQQGYQCGMLWGASMAAGAEAFRRYEDLDKAIGVTIKATQHIMESFKKRTDTIECYDITDCDWSSKMSMAKYFITGKFLSCFNLAEEWAPEAIDAAEEGLSKEWDLPQECISCASEVAKKMGASDEEMVMVAGFAGGLGLSGNACGAFSAAIWM